MTRLNNRRRCPPVAASAQAAEAPPCSAAGDTQDPRSPNQTGPTAGSCPAPTGNPPLEQGKPTGGISYEAMAAALPPPKDDWTTAQGKKAAKPNDKTPAENPAIEIHRFSLMRDHGLPTPLCEAADVQSAINRAFHQEKPPLLSA